MYIKFMKIFLINFKKSFLFLTNAEYILLLNIIFYKINHNETINMKKLILNNESIIATTAMDELIEIITNYKD